MENLSDKTVVQLQEYEAKIMAKKKTNAEMAVFLDTSAGELWLKGKVGELKTVRDRYHQISLEGDAESSMRALAATQAIEKHIAYEVDLLQNTEMRAKLLDDELEKCHNAIMMKEESDRRSR